MKKTLQQMMDEQGITATACKEQASPARTWAHQHTIDKDRSRITDAELQADPKSMQEYDCVDKKELIEQFCDAVVDKLEARGITVSAEFVSTFLLDKLHAQEAAAEKAEAAQKTAEKEEFNHHLAQIPERDAAIFLLHIKYHHSFQSISRFLSYSPSHIENFCHYAKTLFDVEDLATQSRLFEPTRVTMDTPEAVLTGILIESDRQRRAGRPSNAENRQRAKILARMRWAGRQEGTRVPMQTARQVDLWQ